MLLCQFFRFRGLATRVLSLVLFALAGGCGARDAVQDAQQHQIRAFPALELEITATGEREIPLPLGRDDHLTVVHPFGNVEIEAVENGAPRAIAWIEVSAADEETAERALAKSRLRAERSAYGLRVYVEHPERATLAEGNEGLRYIASARVRLEIPPGTRLSVETQRGDVEAIGPLGPTRVVTDHGDIRLRHVRGGVIARASTGDVKLREVSGGPVKAETSFGLIALLGSRASSIQLTNRRGRIVVNNAEATSLVIRSTEGEIKLTQVEGEIEAETATGEMNLSDSTGKKIDVRSGFGDVTVKDVHALELVAHAERGVLEVRRCGAETLELDTGVGDLLLGELEGNVTARAASGRIDAVALRGDHLSLDAGLGGLTLDDVVGHVVIKNSRGEVEITRLEGILSVESEDGSITADGVLHGLHAVGGSGRVRVKARPGSQVISPWSVHAEFGDIVLFLPRGLGFDVEATTGAGIFDTEFPILVEAGLVTEGGIFHGSVAGGGGRIALKTVQGNIAVRRLPGAKEEGGGD